MLRQRRRVIDWDLNKERKNIEKHGIDFKTASEVFLDPYHVSVQDRHVRDEYRWQTIGFVESRGYLLLLVAHTLDAIDDEGEEYEYIRIISARKADREARNRYEAGED